jgi:hypothetical protein
MPPGSRSTRIRSRRLDLLCGALLLAACTTPAPPLPPPLAPVSIPAVVESPPPAAPSALPIAAPLPPAPPLPEREPEPEPEPGPTLPARPYLALDVAARFPRRAVLARGRPLSLAPGGPRFGDSAPGLLSSRVEVIVVEEHPRSFRVVVDDGASRIVVFAPRTLLRLVSTRAAWLALSPDRAPDPAAGARIAPGVVLDEIPDQGPLHHVRGEASRVAFEGWLPDEDLGVSFVPAPIATSGRRGQVAESTEIVNAAGEVLAHLPRPRIKDAAPSFSFDVTPLAGAPTGFQAIHLGLPEIEVNGLVPSASFRKPPPSTGTTTSGGIGSSAGGFITDTEHALIRKGAELLDDAGEPVGVALAESDVFMSFVPAADKSPLRWARILIWPLGFCSVQVRKRDVRPLHR